MQTRIVRLIVADYRPLQIRVDNADRYTRLKSQLKNFYEMETEEADPDLPVISLDQMEQTLALSCPPTVRSGDYRRKIVSLFSLNRITRVSRRRS